MRIVVLYICTGRYSFFWSDFYHSCEQYFFPDCTKHYFVFTDQKIDIADRQRVHVIYQKKIGWPFDTLLRFHMFYEYYEELSHYDYIFFFNANILFLENISNILPIEESYVAVLHPGFYNSARKEFTYETNPNSLAYISMYEGQHYFMGGFNGGKASDYLNLVADLAENIEKDLDNKIIAIWHDESHLNRYLVNRSVKILTPEYAYPEGWVLPFNKKVLVLDKAKFGGHSYLRGEDIADS